MGKVSKKVASKKDAPKAAPKPLYTVLVDGGNSPGDAVVELSDLGRAAHRQLVENSAGQVTLLVKPIIDQGEYGAERRDGVGVKKEPAE